MLNNWPYLLPLLAAFACLYFWKQTDAKSSPEPRQADPSSLRHINCGGVLGFADKHNTHAWLGIPYAQPPVGALRWKAPRPPLPWQGTRQALEFGAVAVQPAGITIEAPEAEWGKPAGSEDCLTLNIFAPRFEPTQLPQGASRLPVMVWIHGGANTCGTSATYGMVRNLAAQDGVIVVSVNYRLGIFGWFHLPELQGEGDTPEDRSGNFGTLDLIAALKWIQQNIAAFGGDPDNVTIWGESAGGLNVYSLLASPLAKGLFHKAIAQSPITLGNRMAQASNYADDADPGHEVSSRELLCKWLVADGKAGNRAEAKTLIARMAPREIASYVRGKTPAELLSAITPGALSFYAMPMVFRDGHVLPAMPLAEVFADRNRYNAVPVIIGTNRDEYKLFMSQNPEYVNLVFGKVPVVRDAKRYNRHAAYMSDLWKAVCADGVAANMLASGHRDVWVYRFDWDEQPPVPFIQPRLLLGASHVLEMAFVFRDIEGEFDPFRSNTKNNFAGRKEVSDAMAGYWTALAFKGAPGTGKSGGLPEWQRWTTDAEAKKLMVFDTSADGGTRMVNEEATVAALEYRLSVDPSLDPKEKCLLYARMFRWPIFAEGSDPERLAAFRDMHCPACRLQELKPAHWP
jgi:para-nitrobenzyl esterase